MNLSDIEIAAKNNESVNSYSPLDKLLHVAFVNLYREYQRDNITKQQASEQKRNITQQYSLIKNELSAAHALSVKYADSIKQTDEAVTALCKQSADANISDMNLLFDACQIIDTLLGGTVTERVVRNNRRL